MAGNQVARFADVAMYHAAEAERAEDGDGEAALPRVTLVQMTRNPLGTMAAASELYRGTVCPSPVVNRMVAEEWLHDMTRTRLQTPLEFVSLHFLLENVSRGFTHQLVRQRTAAYVQESMRFAVKDDAGWAVYMPPSIAELPDGHPRRELWIQAVKNTGTVYAGLVNNGIPAEDARGLLPTNILTRVHYHTNLRNLLEHAGNRLCTQAQFEWRLVFQGIVNAIRGFPSRLSDADGGSREHSLQWQYDAIADLFRPICYRTGKCEFMAATDRHCNIRERVNSFHDSGIPSAQWDSTVFPAHVRINPAEWLLDPASARKAPGND